MRTSAVLISLLISSVANAASGIPTAPGSEKFDFDGDGYINPGPELTVLKKHDKWPDLAAVDFDVDGSIDPGRELDAYNARLAGDPTLAEDILDAKDTIGSAPGFVVAPAAPDEPEAQIPTTTAGILLRKAYEDVSVLGQAAEHSEAAPALFTFTHDFDADSSLATIAGSLTVFKRWGINTPYEPGRVRVTAAALNAGLETEADIRPGLGLDEESSFTARAGGEIETQGSLFSTEYYRANAFVTSDYEGSFARAGVEAEWEPTNTDWAIGVARRLPGTLLSVRWRPVLHVEYQHDLSGEPPAGLTGIGDSLLVGPIVSAQAWLDYGFLSRAYLDMSYYGLFDALDDWNAFDYFEISANYNLDAAKHAAITAKYRVGHTPKVREAVDEFTVGFGLKF